MRKFIILVLLVLVSLATAVADEYYSAICLGKAERCLGESEVVKSWIIGEVLGSEKEQETFIVYYWNNNEVTGKEVLNLTKNQAKYLMLKLVEQDKKWAENR